MTNEFPAAYVLRVKILDALALLCGMVVLAVPGIFRLYPGDIDTTVHVTLGSLIVVCAAFRVLVAWGSAWLEIVLFVLGLLTFLLPRFMHMTWDARYNTLHLAIGAAAMALSLISGLMTFFELRRIHSAAATPAVQGS